LTVGRAGGFTTVGGAGGTTPAVADGVDEAGGAAFAGVCGRSVRGVVATALRRFRFLGLTLMWLGGRRFALAVCSVTAADAADA
jgi:hypothetical protein